ncbi:MAG: aminopeptidase N [Pelistega sp.]|nr:aminopeptidase N [Pelistega sp.]
MSTRSETIYRHDYQAYPFAIHKVDLHFALEPKLTRVTNTMQISALSAQVQDLVLDGEDIQLEHIYLNGERFNNYSYADNQLVLKDLQGQFELKIISTCSPASNTTLMGLYVSGQSFFTQCEAEGFRRITFFPDRPDVMSEYFVTLEADKALYPYLLSNGNLLSTQDLDNGRHQAVWHDPFLKPSYLFALVAGDFDIREKTCQTQSGRDVLLQVYSDRGNGEQTLWALDCLERSMRWDEQRFGLELDLDRFMIVAVRDFNMGAMENKGLNIFNAAYVLADPETATDTNFEDIESVIGHEYFHNWTGNRITCRDWFQLSLKEGLTVFRDQEFSADMMAQGLSEAAAQSARAVKRIDDVSRLRAAQFPEDAGPMAHPIRPENYQEISNFYTATIYEKGAEVIRMQHTLLGEAGFRAGMDEYFRRHDGQAVTCDDFVNAMESVYSQQNPGKDLSVFRHWYSQAGTPHVHVQTEYDAIAQTYTIHLEQSCEKVGIEKTYTDFTKKPFHIPFHIGLLSEQGEPLKLDITGLENASLSNHGDGVILALKEASASWTIQGVIVDPNANTQGKASGSTQTSSAAGDRLNPEVSTVDLADASTRAKAPILSVLRDFSAPVIVSYDRPNSELAVLCAHDTNHFARWEAVQEFCSREILRLMQAILDKQALSLDPLLSQVWLTNIQDPQIDAAYRSCLLSLPAEKELKERVAGPLQPLALFEAREFVRKQLASDHRAYWQAVYQRNHQPAFSQDGTVSAYSPDALSIGHRSLKNLALAYLLSIQDSQALAWAQLQYAQAQHMTDRMGALNALMPYAQEALIQAVLGSFYERFADNPLVVDKWFALQACSPKSGLAQIQQLLQHPAFTLRNPNRARALVFQFCLNNTPGFHQADGAAYDFWADQVLALDALNPEIAARLARTLDNWARFADPHKALMHKALNKVASSSTLSKNTQEIIQKALAI